MYFNIGRATRDERLDIDLSAANLSLSQFDQNDDLDLFTVEEKLEIERHLQNISWATDWFIFAREKSTHAPEHSPLNALEKMLRKVNALVEQLEKLTQGPESEAFTKYLGSTLRKVYRMREILDEAIKRKKHTRR